jgi:hypothetical protein
MGILNCHSLYFSKEANNQATSFVRKGAQTGLSMQMDESMVAGKPFTLLCHTELQSWIAPLQSDLFQIK